MLAIWLLLAGVLILVTGLYFSESNWGGWTVNWIDGWVRILCRVWHRQANVTLELPEQGAAIVVANHISGLDPFILITACRRPLRFLIATEQYHRPILHWLFKAAGCIPVDRLGRPEKALRQAHRALQQGEVLAIFPHGKIHLDNDPPRRIKAGVIRLANWAQAPIYPVRIEGVAAQGSVLLAPFIPSRIRLRLHSPLDVSMLNTAELTYAITQSIETPTTKT